MHRQRPGNARARALTARGTVALTAHRLGFGLLIAAFLFGFAASGAAREAAPPDAEASRAVIERQLDAFSRDAWAEAFDFAGPGVRAAFETPERFAAMVRGGYPMVWRYRSVEFLGAEAVEGGLQHRLRIVDDQGRAFRLVYLLKSVEGVWRIEGVLAEDDQALSI